MAICIVKTSTQLGPQFVLTPERYNPKRRMTLSESDPGVLLSEIVSLENDVISANKEYAGDWYQINTSDAMGGYLRVPDRTEKINSNKKHLKQGDVIISRLRPYLRQVAYVDVEEEKLCASTEFYVLRARNKESIAFLVPFLLSEVAQTVFANSVEGSQHPRFKEEDILSLVVPAQLYKERNNISSRIELAVKNYREYEASLIHEISYANNVISN